MSDKEDYERTVNPLYHDTQKIIRESEQTPTFVYVIYAAMILFLVALAVVPMLIHGVWPL